MNGFEQASSETHDYTRVLADERGATTLLIVAEGAGSHGAAAAASAAIEALRNQRLIPEFVLDADFWERQLGVIDQMLFANDDCGECSLAVAACCRGEVVGASAGDCGIWMSAEGECFELTGQQRLKPRVGSGEALPTGFGPFPAGEAFVLATHALARRHPADAVGTALAGGPAASVTALRALAESTRGYDPLRLGVLVVSFQ